MPAEADTWQATVARLTVEEIRRALARLPDEQREALERAYFGGQTHREIAAQTGVPLGTVKSRLGLGLDKLREDLTEAGGGAARRRRSAAVRPRPHRPAPRAQGTRPVRGRPARAALVARPRRRLPGPAFALGVVLALVLDFALARVVPAPVSPSERYQRLLGQLAARGDVIAPLQPQRPGLHAAAALVLPQRGPGALAVGAMAPAPPGKVYQVWFAGGSGITSAGTFSAVPRLPSVVRLRRAALGYRVAMVTVEPAPTGSAPPTQPSLSGVVSVVAGRALIIYAIGNPTNGTLGLLAEPRQFVPPAPPPCGLFCFPPLPSRAHAHAIVA